jgi:hypothetical protein
VVGPGPEIESPTLGRLTAEVWGAKKQIKAKVCFGHCSLRRFTLLVLLSACASIGLPRDRANFCFFFFFFFFFF